MEQSPSREANISPVTQEIPGILRIPKIHYRGYKILPRSGVPRNFFLEGGVQQIQLRTEDGENGDLGAQPPSQGFWRQL